SGSRRRGPARVARCSSTPASRSRRSARRGRRTSRRRCTARRATTSSWVTSNQPAPSSNRATERSCSSIRRRSICSPPRRSRRTTPRPRHCSPSACWRSSTLSIAVPDVATYTIRALDETTWDAFAALVDRNDGVFGGCWCLGFHLEGGDKTLTAAMRRRRKLERVQEGKAHAALVFDRDDCVGWCQFGAPDEVPRIKSRAVYEKG